MLVTGSDFVFGSEPKVGNRAGNTTCEKTVSSEAVSSSQLTQEPRIRGPLDILVTIL